MKLVLNQLKIILGQLLLQFSFKTTADEIFQGKKEHSIPVQFATIS